MLVPANLSLRTFGQLRSFLAESEKPRPELNAFFSMADRRNRLHREVIDQIPQNGTRIADTVVPAWSIIEQVTRASGPGARVRPVQPGREPLRAEERQA